MDIDLNVDVKIAKEYFGRVGSKMPKVMRRAVAKMAFLLEAAGKTAITSGWTRAVLTGRLRGSIAAEVHDASALIGPETNYDVFVHGGTRFMNARPFMWVALEREQPFFQ